MSWYRLRSGALAEPKLQQDEVAQLRLVAVQPLDQSLQSKGNAITLHVSELNQTHGTGIPQQFDGTRALGVEKHRVIVALGAPVENHVGNYSPHRPAH